MSKGTCKERVKSSVVVERLDRIIDLLTGRDFHVVRWAGDRHTPNTDRTINTTRTRLTVSGTLINFKILINSGTASRDVYVRASLEDEAQQFKGDICYGYVETGKQPHGNGGLVVKAGDYIRVDSWSYAASVVLQPVATILQGKQIAGGWTGTSEGPLDGKGKIRFITGTDPAAGVEVSETVPTGARWRLRNFRCQLTTSTQTATRTVRLTFDDGTTIFFASPAGASLTASSPRTFMAPAGYTSVETAFDGAQEMRLPIPPDLILFAGYRIKTVVGAIKSNDNWGVPYLQVEEWLEP